MTPPLLLIATAEPYGAYHLRGLDRAVLAGWDVRHLLPGSGEVQRPGWVPTTTDIGVLPRADLVLVTGGGLSPWTAAVAAWAGAAGVPVAYGQVSWLPDGAAAPPAAVRFVAAAAVARSTVPAVRALTGHQDVVTTGTPRRAAPGRARQRVLVTPVVSAEVPGGQAGLRAAARRLASAGWDVRVCEHPREPAGLWDDFAVVSGRTPAQQWDGVGLLVGTTTTRMLDAVARGVPVLRVTCGRGDLDDHPLLAAVGPLLAPTDVPAAAAAAQAVDSETAQWLLGPDRPAGLERWVQQLLR